MYSLIESTCGVWRAAWRVRRVAWSVHLAEDGAGQQLVLQELRRQGVDVDGVQQGVQVLGPALHVPADPVRTGLVHLKGGGGERVQSPWVGPDRNTQAKHLAMHNNNKIKTPNCEKKTFLENTK